MHLIKLIFKYLRYLIVAKTRYSIHSPFVFKFYSDIILSDKHFYPFDSIAKVRQALLKNQDEITITDFGAGSMFNNGKKKKISTIAKNAAKPEKFGKLFFRIIEETQAQNIVELGTSLGLSTSYLASANKNANVQTLEGCPETAKMAQKVFNSQQLHNIKITVGNFDDTFPSVLEKIGRIDFLFIDGNHQYEPTLRYFQQSLPYIHENTIIIFDDIHWSDGMEKAWKEIKENVNVSVSIDLFFVGLVFFKKGQVKEHFILKY